VVALKLQSSGTFVSSTMDFWATFGCFSRQSLTRQELNAIHSCRGQEIGRELLLLALAQRALRIFLQFGLLCHQLLSRLRRTKKFCCRLEECRLQRASEASFLIPSSFSHRTLNGRKPHILGSDFSRRLKVGLKSSCSTLSRRSSGATKYRLISRFGCNAKRSLIRSKPE